MKNCKERYWLTNTSENLALCLKILEELVKILHTVSASFFLYLNTNRFFSFVE